MTREEFHNIVKEYSQIKLYENSEKDRELMYIDDGTLGWYDDKINAVRIINRFIMFDDNYGHLFVTTPTVPVLICEKLKTFQTN